MTPVLVSVDKAGDLKLGARKCRLYKKDEVVKVAKKYGINTEKKTVGELCSAIRSRTQSSPMNNIPLAKLYPEAAKKRVAAKKRAEKKIAANFVKGMVTKNANIAKLRQLNENTPKSAKNTQNVIKTQKKMNTTQIKAQLRKMQPLIKKLDSQARSKASQLIRRQKKLKELQKQLKKRINKANPQIEEERKEVEKQIRALQAEIPELENKVAALKTKYKNMKEVVTVPKPPSKPRPKLTKKQLEELKWRRYYREMARLR